MYYYYVPCRSFSNICCVYALFLVSPIQYLVTPPTTYASSSFTTDCNLGVIRGLRRCPGNARLTDGVTNEGIDFDPNNFMGWNDSFDLEFDFNEESFYFTQVDIYYYSNPSEGYGLPNIRTGTSESGTGGGFTNVVSTFIDNSDVSQFDDNVQVLTLIILTPFSSIGFDQQFFRLQFSFNSYLVNQTFISEINFYSRTSK